MVVADESDRADAAAIRSADQRGNEAAYPASHSPSRWPACAEQPGWARHDAAAAASMARRSARRFSQPMVNRITIGTAMRLTTCSRLPILTPGYPCRRPGVAASCADPHTLTTTRLRPLLGESVRHLYAGGRDLYAELRDARLSLWLHPAATRLDDGSAGTAPQVIGPQRPVTRDVAFGVDQPVGLGYPAGVGARPCGRRDAGKSPPRKGGDVAVVPFVAIASFAA